MQKFTKTLLIFTLVLSKNIYAQTDTTAKTLNSVVVTGQFKPQSLRNSVYQVRVITPQRIALSGATNIQQVLNNQLGMRFSNDAILGTDIQLNGMTGRAVKIMVDGVPLLDRFDERTSLSQIDINTVDHIEIVEGPMSVSYGTDAMAGVINIITKKNYKPSFSATARVQEESAGDEYYPFSYEGSHLQNIGLNYKAGNWNFSAGGTHNDNDGFGGDEYGRDKSWLPKEQWLANARIGYSKANFDIYYRADAVTEKIKDRNKMNIDLSAPFARAYDQSFTTDKLMHQLQSNIRFNKNIELSTIAAYTNFKRETNTLYKDFVLNTVETGHKDGEDDISKLNSFNFKNTLQYNVSDKFTLQPGIDINHEKIKGDRIKGTPAIDDYAFFASAEYKINDKINIRPGIRLIENSKYEAPVIPALNTKFVLNKNLDLRLAYGQGYRAPVLRELYLDFHDVNHDLNGNPNLKAEKSTSYNGSLTWTATQWKNVSFTSALGGFYNKYKNQITLFNTDPASLKYSYMNIDKAKNIGFSIDNRLVYKNLQATLGFNYTGFSGLLDANTYKDDSKELLWSPEINTNLIYEIKKLKTSLGLFYKFVGERPAFSFENSNSVPQPGYYLTKTSSYNLADFTVTTTVNRLASVTAGVKNIFDVTAVNSNTVNTSSTAHSTAGALSVSYGRSYFLGLNLQWNKK